MLVFTPPSPQIEDTLVDVSGDGTIAWVYDGSGTYMGGGTLPISDIASGFGMGVGTYTFVECDDNVDPGIACGSPGNPTTISEAVAEPGFVGIQFFTYESPATTTPNVQLSTDPVLCALVAAFLVIYTADYVRRLFYS